MIDANQKIQQLLDESQALRDQNDELKRRLADCGEKLPAKRTGEAEETAKSKETETKLGDAKLFQIAFESAPIGMALIDSQGRFLRVNRALCELVGRSEDEMLDLGFQQISHPDDLEVSVLGYQRMLAGEIDLFRVEKRILHVSGAVKWVHVNIAVGRDDDSVCFVAQLQDITERKQAERQLRLTQFTIDSSSTPIRWMRPDATFVYANDAALRQSGYTRKEMLSMTVHDINPVFTVQYWSEWLKNLKRDESLTFETLHLNKDGSSMPVEVTVNLLQFEGEQFLFAFVTDITDRKQADADARRHRDELSHVLRVSTMGEMATGIAHELKQPLGAIATYSYIAKSIVEKFTSSPHKLQEILGKLEEQSIRAGDIVRQLRSFGSKSKSIRVPVDLNTLVRNVAEFVELDIRQAEAVLTMKFDEPSPGMLIDEIQIQQVLVNLIRNSIDAMQETPTSRREVTVSTRTLENGSAEVTVSDSGQGLTEHEIDQVFEAFFSTKQEGMGMGLAISRSIVEAHGGQLWAKPNSDHGVTFGFTIPLENGHAQ